MDRLQNAIESNRVHRTDGEMKMAYVEQRPRPNQEPRSLSIHDEDIPIQIELDKQEMMALDNTIREIYYVPWKYRNLFLSINWGDLMPIRFDEHGSSYIELAFKKKDVIHLGKQPTFKFYLKDGHKLEEIIDLLEVAKDICDHCGAPLPLNPQNWFNFADGGGAIASIFHCQLCDEISIRWEKEFFKDHYKTLEMLRVDR